ncbi:MAG TPA: LytTR family transcriptional regulator DNA-binding domain-containing protein [Blastocatellia bacterium]|nr:LytTR family transcriptional regulator DNA-binding domain-containing protein [Blastocatellia bacterium]
MKIKTLIVDDEAIARDRVRRFLAAEPDIDVLGECRNGREAVAAIKKLQPDLVFLDIQMPQLDGFGTLAALDPAHLPAVVFVTAFDQYAIRAFTVHALDYLLKPFSHERFRHSLAHARKQLNRDESGGLRNIDNRLLSLLEGIKTPTKFADRLVIKATGRVYFLKTEDIDWIEACGNYVTLHVGPETHLLRETLSHLENRLDPGRFLRIHRSRLVNLDCIKELTPLFNGDYTVALQSGDELTLSRTYRDRLQELIERLS